MRRVNIWGYHKGVYCIQGVINLLKPPGMTSHEVVQEIRKIVGIKAGHIGTLDPMACGVLPICIGKATRLAEYTMNFLKEYRAEMVLGIDTDTQDITGSILSRGNIRDISETRIKEVMTLFIGDIEQTVPAYSAAQYQGKRFYQLARKNIPVPEKTRKVTIKHLGLFHYYEHGENPRVIFDVTCSRGTYIRTICKDIGNYLGCGAAMSFLIRTALGPFTLQSTYTVDEIKKKVKESNFEFILPMRHLVEHLPTLLIDAEKAYLIKNGLKLDLNNFQVLEGSSVSDLSGDVKVMRGNTLVAIGVAAEFEEIPKFKPKKVFI